MIDSIRNTTKKSNIRCFCVRPPRDGPPEGVQIITLASWVPPFVQIKDQVTFDTLFKHLALDFIIPVGIDKIIFVDQSIVFLKDPARLLKIDMNNSTIAAPLFTTDKHVQKYTLSYEREFRMDRGDRPFHTGRLFVINLVNARKQRYFENARNLFDYKLYSFQGSTDDDIFNQLQLPCQFITLPEETSFAHKLTNHKTRENAFSLFIFDHESEKELYGAKKYNTMKEFVYKKYVKNDE